MGKRSVRDAVVVACLTMLMGLVPASAAFADAASPASCAGHEASGISPAGSSEELPGGMPQLKAFITQTFPGAPPGAIYSAIARVRAGSHEGCDAVFG